MPRLALEPTINLIKSLMEENNIKDLEVSYDTDSGGSWCISHVVTVTGHDDSGVIYRAKARFPTEENHFYVKGMGFMGKVAHFEVGATFPFEDLPPIDLQCGVLQAKANLMRTTHLVLRTYRAAWRGMAEKVITMYINDLVKHVENEKSLAAFNTIIQTTLISDQEVENAEGDCIIEA